jgi:hypothetical protein
MVQRVHWHEPEECHVTSRLQDPGMDIIASLSNEFYCVLSLHGRLCCMPFHTKALTAMRVRSVADYDRLAIELCLCASMSSVTCCR